MNASPLDLDEQHISPLTDIGDLEDRGHRIVEALAGDLVPVERTQRLIEILKDEKKETFHGDLLYYLTSERFTENQARVIWEEVLAHKFELGRLLGRNPGIRIAVIDYLVNIRKLIHAPRIIKTSDFQQTVKMARTDPLTGLYNRRFFAEQFKRILDVAQRMKASVSLMMTDLDNFKQFNDRHGHQAGDLFLQEVSRLVRGTVRASDLVARYGGDEFALLLPKANKAEAAAVAEKVRQTIQENCVEMGITMSLGVASFPEDGNTRDDLVSAADEALYAAKKAGRNLVSFLTAVEFRYRPDGPLQKVTLVGEFNRWSRSAHPMKLNPETGEWELTIPLKAGRYRYKFLVDDLYWVIDPLSAETDSDGFGGQCSVLSV